MKHINLYVAATGVNRRPVGTFNVTKERPQSEAEMLVDHEKAREYKRLSDMGYDAQSVVFDAEYIDTEVLDGAGSPVVGVGAFTAKKGK